MAFITDSAQNGPNGIIVVDLDSGTSWHRLHDHPSTKAEQLKTFLPIVEGRPFLEYQQDGSVKHGAGMSSDGIAIGSDGARLYYCPLGSVATDALADQSLDEQNVSATVSDEDDRGGASDGLESDTAGYIYSTNYEHNAILRRGPDGKWETVTHDPRLYGLTHSRLPLMAIFMSLLISYTIRGDSIKKDATCGASRILYFASGLTHSLFCCGNQTAQNIVVNSDYCCNASIHSCVAILNNNITSSRSHIYTSTAERKAPTGTPGDNNVYLT
jgi:Major royal jelly protein